MEEICFIELITLLLLRLAAYSFDASKILLLAIIKLYIIKSIASGIKKNFIDHNI